MLTLTFNGQEVVRDIRELGFWAKMIGLEGGAFGDKIYFKTRYGIHTFGLAQPIDVLVLGEDGRVGAIFENLMSSQVRFWNPKFKHVFELPAGTLKRVENIKTGIFVWYDK
jgi:hypothetical protein